jgi:hypothetical protein
LRHLGLHCRAWPSGALPFMVQLRVPMHRTFHCPGCHATPTRHVLAVRMYNRMLACLVACEFGLTAGAAANASLMSNGVLAMCVDPAHAASVSRSPWAVCMVGARVRAAKEVSLLENSKALGSENIAFIRRYLAEAGFDTCNLQMDACDYLSPCRRGSM